MKKAWIYLPLSVLFSGALAAALLLWPDTEHPTGTLVEVDIPPEYSVESGDSQLCSGDIFSPSEDPVRDGCVDGPNGEKFDLTVFQRGDVIERIVVLDSGGPGLRSQAIANRMSSLALPFLEKTLTVSLDEGWESFSFSSLCRDALDELIDEARTGRSSDKSAELIGLRCVPPSRYGDSMEALLNSIVAAESGVPIGIVAASFGAKRVLSLAPETLEQVEWVLLDSPFLGNGASFPVEELSSAAANAIEHLPTICGLDCLDIENWLTPSVEENFPLDTEIALLAVAGSPESNIEYMRNRFERVSGDRKLQSGDIAGKFLRAKFGFTYDESWFGYWSEICPAFSDWKLPAGEKQAPPLKQNIASFYSAIHRPCQYHRALDRERPTREAVSYPRICTVTGTYDPYVLPHSEKLLAAHSPTGHLQRDEYGHLPLFYDPALIEHIGKFVDGGPCGGMETAESARHGVSVETPQTLSLLDEMLAAEESVALCMQRNGLEYVPFISQQTLKNLNDMEPGANTPEEFDTDPTRENGPVPSFGIALPVFNKAEQEIAADNSTDSAQNPNVEHANRLPEEAKEKYYTTLFGESPEHGCAISAYRNFDDRVRALEGVQADEIPIGKDDDIREEIYGHPDVLAEERELLRCLADNGFDFANADEVTGDLERRMASWMDDRAEYELDEKEEKSVGDRKLHLMAELKQIKNDEIELAAVYSMCAESYHEVVNDIAAVVLKN